MLDLYLYGCAIMSLIVITIVVIKMLDVANDLETLNETIDYIGDFNVFLICISSIILGWIPIIVTLCGLLYLYFDERREAKEKKKEEKMEMYIPDVPPMKHTHKITQWLHKYSNRKWGVSEINPANPNILHAYSGEILCVYANYVQYYGDSTCWDGFKYDIPTSKSELLEIIGEEEN